MGLNKISELGDVEHFFLAFSWSGPPQSSTIQTTIGTWSVEIRTKVGRKHRVKLFMRVVHLSGPHANERNPGDVYRFEHLIDLDNLPRPADFGSRSFPIDIHTDKFVHGARLLNVSGILDRLRRFVQFKTHWDTFALKCMSPLEYTLSGSHSGGFKFSSFRFKFGELFTHKRGKLA